MSFASLMAQMKKKNGGPDSSLASPKVPTVSHHTSTKSQKQEQPSDSRSNGKPHQQVATPYDTDPAVARLKAARKAEREAAAAKKGASLAKKHTAQTPKATKAHQTTARKPQNKHVEAVEPVSVPKKKLSYKELMAQAANVDSSKMALTIKQRSHSPPPVILKRREDKQVKKQSPAPAPVPAPKVARATLPQESPAAKQKPVAYRPPNYRSKKREDDYDDDDLSDFIVSEEEEVDYRSEIQGIFGRNRKRQYNYDDYSDDDDMEATGADVLQEETRSSKYARIEEEREAEIERLKKLEKMKRLKKA